MTVRCTMNHGQYGIQRFSTESTAFRHSGTGRNPVSDQQIQIRERPTHDIQQSRNGPEGQSQDVMSGNFLPSGYCNQSQQTGTKEPDGCRDGYCRTDIGTEYNVVA